MELKLNFKLGSKTLNGRYYDPDMLIDQFDKLLNVSGGIPVGPDAANINEQTGGVPDDKLVGTVKSYRIDDHNDVWFEIDGLSDLFEDYINKNPGKVQLTLYGFGVMDEEKVIHEFMLASLFTTID